MGLTTLWFGFEFWVLGNVGFELGFGFRYMCNIWFWVWVWVSVWISIDKISHMTSLIIMIVCMLTDVPNFNPLILPNPHHPSSLILT